MPLILTEKDAVDRIKSLQELAQKDPEKFYSDRTDFLYDVILAISRGAIRTRLISRETLKVFSIEPTRWQNCRGITGNAETNSDD